MKEKFREQFRDHSCRRAPRKLRNEPLAGTQSGRYVDFLGLTD